MTGRMGVALAFASALIAGGTMAAEIDPGPKSALIVVVSNGFLPG
jgi:hypothetical protein